VIFRYKNDEEATPQFGLVAEEVAKVNPNLVLRDEEGKICTVRYDAVNAMLLNEFLKEEHHKVQQLEANVAEQQKEIKALGAILEKQAAQIQKVSADLELGKMAAQTLIIVHRQGAHNSGNSISLGLTQLLPRPYTHDRVCGVALQQSEMKLYKY